MRRSLTAELVRSAALSLPIAMAAGAGAWAAYVEFLPQGVYQIHLANSLDRIKDALATDAQGRPVVAGLGGLHASMYQVLPRDLIYQVVAADGEVLLSSDGELVALLDPAQLEAGQVAHLERHGVALQALAEPWEGPGPRRFVVVGRSERFEASALDIGASSARRATVVATLLSIGTFALVVIVIVNRLLRRLRETSAAAAMIAPANLSARLDVAGVPKEIAPLIESFNAALERLETGFRNQQEFLAMAAHELKTPIALLRAQVELDGGPQRAGMLADLDHMGRHVHQLLHLAEVSDVASMALASTDVGAVVEDAVRALGRMSAKRGVAIQVDDGGAPTLLQADASGLFILVRNLLENAIHHAPAGSCVTAAISPQRLSILDQGPGVPEADLPLLFKRFWRGAQRQDDGAGLGLSICQEIARAHGWCLHASNRALGGAEFTVEFLPAGAA